MNESRLVADQSVAAVDYEVDRILVDITNVTNLNIVLLDEKTIVDIVSNRY